MADPPAFFDRIFENNRRWIARKLADDPAYFEHLARVQEPDVLFIGCADSRVPPVSVMGAEPGDVFVHRNVANVVSPSDMNVQSVIEYAITHLGVAHVIVCGHYECGGVAAALTPKSFGLLDPWLRQIKDISARHEKELAGIEAIGARNRRLVELNVEAQCENVMKTAAFQRAQGSGEPPKVHGWVFDIGSGALVDLGFDCTARFARLVPTYGLDFGR